jgi:hypothetical protein
MELEPQGAETGRSRYSAVSAPGQAKLKYENHTSFKGTVA